MPFLPFAGQPSAAAYSLLRAAGWSIGDTAYRDPPHAGWSGWFTATVASSRSSPRRIAIQRMESRGADGGAGRREFSEESGGWRLDAKPLHNAVQEPLRETNIEGMKME